MSIPRGHVVGVNYDDTFADDVTDGRGLASPKTNPKQSQSEVPPCCGRTGSDADIDTEGIRNCPATPASMSTVLTQTRATVNHHI